MFLQNNSYKIYYYTNDEDWQKPNITEYQFYKIFLSEKNIPMNYFAFPWATLIDNPCISNSKLNNTKLINPNIIILSPNHTNTPKHIA